MQQVITLFRALSDETRLRILNLLGQSEELCVCDLEDIVGVPQAKMSRHLAYLRRAGLVRSRRQGLWMLYSLAKPRSAEHRLVMECMEAVVGQASPARRDRELLEKNIRKGCCATYTCVQPRQHGDISQTGKENQRGH
jgi:ArsR family transcriptional regulator